MDSCITTCRLLKSSRAFHLSLTTGAGRGKSLVHEWLIDHVVFCSIASLPKNITGNTTVTASESPEMGNTDMDNATLAGVVSAIITFLALVVSSVQLLYQYYTNVNLSALGSRNCNDMVMGPWAELTDKKWRWLEFRYEVIFKSPIIFVSWPSNNKGPVNKAPIYSMRGTPQSFKDTRIWQPDVEQLAQQKEILQAGLPSYTLEGQSDNVKEDSLKVEKSEEEEVERTRRSLLRLGLNREASWATMLRELQVMERDSTKWQEELGGGRESIQLFERRTLAVAIQPRAYSWDMVPNFKNPLAQTVLTHLVEIAAMLGIYWTVWDSAGDRYRAEGNGFILFGSYRPEQGLVFQFLRAGRSSFKGNRIMPADEVKKFCFGFAPTLFCYQHDQTHRAKHLVNDDLGTIPELKLGSKQDIAETLSEIGCPKSTADRSLGERKTSHIFPMAFEILGMLGMTLRWRNSAFRVLPNPTIFCWDRRGFKTRLLLDGFRKYFKDHINKAQTQEITPVQPNLATPAAQPGHPAQRRAYITANDVEVTCRASRQTIRSVAIESRGL
ncbi:uncharacterized protein BCR38DRAFT_485841 [Pseudomassariella vexata]|uniref:Modin n=1 Tax=Pseudomassariella vexata TaxID=1141098 RepID=A0A1Y2DUW1_9PEZI|nr:uncharacterized protein BCR38DRAFT_485841 [Pseudomassariella vexata]ORY63072.1 hypothetical protein BCR38DRAFT_485841 [Pseudomassariella vexata]